MFGSDPTFIHRGPLILRLLTLPYKHKLLTGHPYNKVVYGPNNNLSSKQKMGFVLRFLVFASLYTQLITRAIDDVKGIGAFPIEHEETFAWTQTLLAQLLLS